MTVDELKKIVDEAVENGDGDASVIIVSDEGQEEGGLMRDAELAFVSSYDVIGTVLEIHG